MIINLDANASYGLLPEVKERIALCESLYNPSSIHQNGQKARALLEDSRSTIADFIGLSSEQRLIFTSGASESNTQALFYPFWKEINNNSVANLIVSTIEHPSILEAAVKLSDLGIEVRYFNPFATDAIPEFFSLIDSNTKMVSIMMANNETGLILPVEDIFSRVKKYSNSIITHTDAVQAVGKIAFRADSLNADFISISAHKLGALSGTGALIVPKDFENRTLISGGPQESRWRAGTENVIGISSFAAAISCWKQNSLSWIGRMQNIKTELLHFIASSFPTININTTLQSLPNTINIEIPGRLADDLVVAFDLLGIAISSGSACASGKPLPSHVLLAMGKTPEQARSALRISFRADLSDTEIGMIKDAFLKLFN